MSETDLEPTTEDEGGKESETPGEIVEDDEGGDENEQRERDANEELGEQEEDYEEKEGDEYEDEEYGEEEKEGEGGKVIKKAGLKVLDKKDVVHDENEEEVSEEEDIYAERKEGELRAELRAEKRMSLQVDDDDEDDEEYEDEEEEDYISGPYLSLDSTKNPNPKYPHVAVAEKGLNPLIIIYEWPSMEHIRVLRGGAKRAFACLHYSPDGRFLCSQGCEPDYFLTVWNWKKGRILRQQKAYGQDVFNAMFSDYSLGNLTTAGYGHIKFWKLAKTFTGLKLMGKIGRFGKTEMCDIIGFIALPDEQVVSGCEWGNMLIWNEGLVKAEVCRKAGASCHEGYISQLLYDDKDEEIISIGTDGFIRAWDFKLIEKADLVGDSPKIKIENLYALEVGKGYDKASLLYIEKQDNTNPEKSLWFAQDHPLAPEKVFRCHAGGVRSVAACPYDTYVASYGDDGRLLFYNYATRRVVLAHKFAAGGGFLVWLDTSVEPTGDVVVCGGADGLVRVAVVALQNREAAGEAARDDDFLCLVQTTKPHTMRITSMAVREAQGLLVTGSEDATIFVYQILPRHDYVSLNPIGFVNVPSAVTHLTWKPHEDPSDSLEDITDPEMYSLEQLKQKAEYDRKMKLANDHKQEVLESLQKLKEKFASVAQSNKTLPLKLRIPYGEFKIDHRIEDDLEDELEDMLALEKRKLAHQAEKSSIALQKLQDYYYNVLDTHLVTVRAFKNPKLKAYTFRSRALGPEFQQAKRFVKEKLDRADKLQRPAGIRGSKFAPSTTIKHRLRLGTWLKGIGSVGTNIRMNVKLQRMLLKYYERKRAKELREEQWNRMTTMKPDPKVSHPDDVAAMEQAERTIGDFKMKTDPNFTVYQIQKNYNDRVLQLRDKKVALINHINELNERLTKRHKELPSSDIILPPPIPEVLKEEEFPERELTLQEEDVLAYYPTPPPSASTRAASASAEDGLEEAHKPSLARAQVRLLRIHSPVTVSSATGLSPGSFINYFVCSVN
ncbi:Uncharacterized protein GBIM_18409 [Gryllus bimaculatus]|nr:Uncharacterized protein GBIM_18409 [Gryllus bimaculatus]